MSTFELETAKIAVAYTHSPHLPKDKPVPCCIMLLTEPGCNKPSICIASVLPWSWTRGDRPLEREKHWKTMKNHCSRNMQKGSERTKKVDFLLGAHQLFFKYPETYALFILVQFYFATRTELVGPTTLKWCQHVSTTNCLSMKTDLFLSSLNMMQTLWPGRYHY